MAKVNYRATSLSLTSVRTDERHSVNSKYIVFTRVDGPIAMRINSAQNPEIRVDRAGWYEACGPDVLIDDIFISNAVGNGSIEYIATDSLRVGFSAPDAESSESRVRAHIIPTTVSASSINSVELMRNMVNPITFGRSSGAATLISTDSINDETYGWRYNCIDIVTASQAANARVFAGVNHEMQVPIQTLLSPSGGAAKQLDGIGWFETETDVYFNFPTGNDVMFRFGFGITSMLFTAANGYDICVGFAVGGAPTRADMVLPGVTEDDIAAVIISNGNNGGVVGAGRTIHYSKILSSGVNGTYKRLKVAMGEEGGVPMVKWFVNGAEADRYTGALPTAFEQKSGAAANVAAQPFLAVGRGNAASTFDVRWGHGMGWIYRHWQP